MYFELLDFMSWVFEASARHQTSPVLFVTLNHTAAEILEFRRQVLTGSLPQGLNVLEFPATYEVETPGFISKEIQSLDAWYKSNPEKNEDARLAKIAEIQKHFIKELQAKLKSKSYDRFPEIKLNNARLLMYKTYMQDLSDFETLYKLSNEDFQIFLDHCKSLESAEKPEEGLKALIAKLQGK
jgi:predicted aminopeptidase